MISMVQGVSRVFYQVGGGHNLDKMPALTEIFHRILTPLYGSQDKALEQIRESRDRKCFLLYEDETPVGVLAFKTIPSNEFVEFGVRNSMEVKSLFVDQSQQNSGRGLGSTLVDKLKEEVEKLGVPYEGIHVTVSETKQESLMFFNKKGFEVAHAWKDRYVKGVTEFLLSCPRRIAAIQQHIVPKLEIVSPRGSQATTDVPELLHIIHQAHHDDIHCLKKLSDGTFISGSKDNCIYKWNEQGGIVKIVDEVEPSHQSERNWITAIEVINDEYWVSGTRNGEIVLWRTGGEYVKNIVGKKPKRSDHVSHPFNLQRVTCLAAGTNLHKPSVYVGFPTMFNTFNLIEGRTESSVKAHDNDWVYVIKPLSEDRLLTVLGDTVEVWKRNELGWGNRERVIPEQRRYRAIVKGQKRMQRAFIPDICSLDPLNTLFGVANFDGSVQTLNIETKSIVQRMEEHRGIVWKVQKMREAVFASSGEDGCVKIWDIRTKRSVHTINIGDGQVTAMLAWDDHTLLTGTCPEQARNYQKSAQIRFYEIRK